MTAYWNNMYKQPHFSVKYCILLLTKVILAKKNEGMMDEEKKLISIAVKNW